MQRGGFPRALALTLLALGTAVNAADTPRPGRARAFVDSWRRGIPASEALETPTKLATDPTIRRVSLKEAIAIGLQNNPRLAARRLEPFRVAEGVLAAQGKFDPTLKGDLSYGRSEIPNVSVLGGAESSIVEDRFANFHLIKLFRTGTQISIDSINERIDNNSRFYQLRPYYKPTLGLSLVQPLLRDFGWDFSYLVVRSAEQTAVAAGYQWEADLANFVLEVVTAYWTVAGTRELVVVRQEAKALAERTVQENQARVNVGLLPPVAVLEAKADVQSREADVITAENDFIVARQKLAQLLLYRPNNGFIPSIVEPIDEAMPEDIMTDFEQSLQTALGARPEIQASAHGVQAQQFNERAAENALLPRLDAVGTIGGNGLSGRPIVQQQSCVVVNQAGQIRCVTPPDNPYAGPIGDAYNRIGDFPNYAVGLKLEVPFANATAEAQAVQSRIARQQAELNHRELLSSVALDVAQSLADLTAARKNIDVTRTARELAEENLRNQEKRHEVGMATTKDLLDFQVKLTNARAEEVRARTSYAVAVDKWRRAQGEILPHYDILVERPGERATPWFARF